MESLKAGDFAKLFKWFSDIVVVQATAPVRAITSNRTGQGQIVGKKVLELPPPPFGILPV
jgi:hypothetical protein